MPDEPLNEPAYELVMPFIACKSNGGIYDDESFVIGFMLGTIDVQLRTCAAFNLLWGAPAALPTGAVAQAELIAMKHHWYMHRLEPESMPGELSPGWEWVTFSHDPNTQGDI